MNGDCSLQSSRRATAPVFPAAMQQALGAGIRLAVPPEFSLTPPRGVPSVGEEPTATEDAAFESRFDVRRERDVLREECGVEGADAGASGRDAAGRADGQIQNTGTNDRDRDRDRDPTSLDATVRRIKREPDVPEIDKYNARGTRVTPRRSRWRCGGTTRARWWISARGSREARRWAWTDPHSRERWRRATTTSSEPSPAACDDVERHIW
jgi:hypothetical protein